MKVVIDKISLMTCYCSMSVIHNQVEKALKEAGLKESYYDPKIDNKVFIVERKPEEPKLVDIKFIELKSEEENNNVKR
jgi:rhodanese-related sulfurtransferase